jgi:hypothetical protein
MSNGWLGDDGPLVLLADSQAEGWLGIWRDAREGDPKDEIETWAERAMVMDVELDEDDPATDYARTCAALEPPVLVALVPFDGGVALALETTGHQATFVMLGDDVVVAKWIFAPGEAHADRALAELPHELPWNESDVVFELATAGVRLHPAASRTEADAPFVPYPLSAGRYALATALHEPDDETSFELFRLRRL